MVVVTLIRLYVNGLGKVYVYYFNCQCFLCKLSKIILKACQSWFSRVGFQVSRRKSTLFTVLSKFIAYLLRKKKFNNPNGKLNTWLQSWHYAIHSRKLSNRISTFLANQLLRSPHFATKIFPGNLLFSKTRSDIYSSVIKYSQLYLLQAGIFAWYRIMIFQSESYWVIFLYIIHQWVLNF